MASSLEVAELAAVDYLNRVATTPKEPDFGETFNVRTSLPLDIYACPIGALVPGSAIDIDMEQRSDPICVYISAYLSKSKSEAELKQLLMGMPDKARERIKAHHGSDSDFSAFELQEGRLLFKDKDKLLVEVPLALRDRVLTAYHNSFMGGHRGRKATLASIKQHLHWIGMSSDVRNYVHACDTCTSGKTPKKLHAGLHPIVKRRSFERVQMDFMEPTTPSKRGYRYILSFVCVSSGKLKCYKMRSRSSLRVAQKLLKILLLGVTPSIIHSDNAPEFVFSVVAKVNKLLGVKGMAGSPYKPSVQGAVENRNKTIATLLTWMCNSAKDDWDMHLPFVESAIWRSINVSTGLTPMFYETGFDPITPFDCQMGVQPDDKAVDFEQWKRNLDVVRSWGMQHQVCAAEEMAKQYDAGKKPLKLEAGQEVFVFWPKKGKLERQWHGPYILERLIEIAGNRSAVVHHLDSPLDRFTVHVDRLTQRHALPDNWALGADWNDWVKKARLDNIDAAELDEVDADKADAVARDLEGLAEEEYIVEKIVDHADRKVLISRKGAKKKKYDMRRFYKVRWLGYSPEHDTLEPEEELLKNASTAVSDYLASIGEIR